MLLIKSIIKILLAIIVFVHPGATLWGVAVYLGIGLVITGILAIGLCIAERKLSPDCRWRTFAGVIDVVLGFIVINNPILTMSIILFLIGFWASNYRVVLFIVAFSFKEFRGLKMISGILIFLLAWELMFNPLFYGLTMVICFAVLLLISGIANLIISFSLWKIKYNSNQKPILATFKS